MRLALVADVHSNLHALESASDEIAKLSPDQILCAGDIVGYGAFPNECCSVVESMCSASIAGNHDRSVRSRDFSRMNPYAAAAGLWTSGVLGDRERRFLSGLGTSERLSLDGKSVAIFHGSPADPDGYVYEESVGQQMLEEAACELLVLGHTHVPFARRFETGLVVNPGSIGQPRDGDPRGSLAVVETADLSCEVVRFGYDVEGAGDAIVSAGLPHILAERLSVGR